MAFSKTMVRKEVTADGYVIEEGTWDGASVTTGNLTADTTVQPEIFHIKEWWVSSNGDNAVNVAQDAGPTILKLTFTSSDAGKYRIKGKAA